MPVSAIIGNFEYSATVPEVSQWFGVPQDQVQAILISRVIQLLVLFDRNIPEPLGRFLAGHEVRTIQ